MERENSEHIHWYGDIGLISLEHMIILGNKFVPISYTLFRILRVLLQHKNKICSYEEILRSVWGESHIHSEYTKNSLRVHIRLLKKLLGKKYAAHLHTIYGRGYAWEEYSTEKSLSNIL